MTDIHELTTSINAARRDYARVIDHLRTAQKLLVRLNFDYGTAYGDYEDDAVGAIASAIKQTEYDRELLVDMIKTYTLDDYEPSEVAQ